MYVSSPTFDQVIAQVNDALWAVQADVALTQLTSLLQLRPASAAAPSTIGLRDWRASLAAAKILRSGGLRRTLQDVLFLLV